MSFSTFFGDGSVAKSIGIFLFVGWVSSKLFMLWLAYKAVQKMRSKKKSDDEPKVATELGEVAKR